MSSLYPATVPFYRRLGYEYGGTFTMFQAPLRELPKGTRDAEIEEVQTDDLEEIRSCWRSFCLRNNGLLESEEAEWWRLRVFGEWKTDLPRRVVVARVGGEVRGYAAFTQESRSDGHGYDIACSHLVGTDQSALQGLLGYFRRFHGVGHSLKWQGPPNEPVELLIPEQSAEIAFQFRFMSRLLDVPAALEARGYPEVSGEAVLDVRDDLFPENAGSFRVQADSGKVSVERADGPGALSVGIGALSSLYTGHVSPDDLARTGALQGGHESLPFLTRLFAGAPPWSADFF